MASVPQLRLFAIAWEIGHPLVYLPGSPLQASYISDKIFSMDEYMTDFAVNARMSADYDTHLSEVRRSPDFLSGFEGKHDAMDFLYNEPASVNNAVLRGRAFQIRDILSTFSRHDFPSEHVRPEIFNRVGMLDEPKAITDCVEKEDLLSTIFLLAVNNSAQYNILRHVFPDDLCARYFQQKLQRRIEAPIQAFDLLDTAASSADPPDQDHIRVQVGIMAAELDHIVKVIKHDRKHRWQGEADTASLLVSMMQAVCRRNYCPGGRSRRRQGLNGNHRSNLFQLLIGKPSNREAGFGLDALQVFTKKAITGQSEGLGIVRGLLVEQGAPLGYIKLFDEITGISID